MSLLFISDEFSLSMLDRENLFDEGPHQAALRPISPAQALAAAYAASKREDLVWAFRDARLARIVSAQFNLAQPEGCAEVKLVRLPNRRRVDQLLVAQYVGPRLPEGATKLPKGATIEWWLV